MTVDEIIEDILIAEGPGDPTKNYLAPNDRGGRTNWGISEKAHPEEWADGKVPSKERARAIYAAVYAAPWTSVKDPQMRALLTDMCVLHGEGNTVRLLSEVLFDTAHMLPANKKKAVSLARLNQLDAFVLKFATEALVAHRCAFMVNIANNDVSQRSNLRGWINRAVKFLL